MMGFDLNVLRILDALLTEGSVNGAASRLGLSKSAVSRMLGTARDIMKDPIMVRAGSRLVPTSRALEIKDRVSAIVSESDQLLQHPETLDFATLDRVFSIRANDALVATIAAPLLAYVNTFAPKVRLLFSIKAQKDSSYLRAGSVDLELGVLGRDGPELRIQSLFQDYFIGVVRKGHPLTQRAVTAVSYARECHVAVSRRGAWEGPIDKALAAEGLSRQVVMVVPSFDVAISIAQQTDLVASVPDRQTQMLRHGLMSFHLPVETEPIAVQQMWHPRSEMDPAHRWLRGCVKIVCSNHKILQCCQIASEQLSIGA